MSDNGLDHTQPTPELIPEMPTDLANALDPADLESLKFMAEAKDKQTQMAQAAQVAFNLYQGHLSTKYQLKQGDGIDLVTGKITRPTLNVTARDAGTSDAAS